MKKHRYIGNDSSSSHFMFTDATYSDYMHTQLSKCLQLFFHSDGGAKLN